MTIKCGIFWRIINERNGGITQREGSRVQEKSGFTPLLQVFHATPDAIIISRITDQRRIDFNEAFLRLTGYSKEEVQDRTSLELNIWEKPDDRKKYLATLQEKGSVHEYEARFRMKSGMIRDGLVSEIETFSLGGELYLLTIVRDITERKQAEEKLRKYREHLEELVRERTIELENKNAELERFNRLFVGRELRMIELKKIIAEYEKKKNCTAWK